MPLDEPIVGDGAASRVGIAMDNRLRLGKIINVLYEQRPAAVSERAAGDKSALPIQLGVAHAFKVGRD